MRALLVIVMAIIAVPSSVTAAEGERYVGATVCASCHGPDNERDAFTTWSVSKHSRTYVQLGTGYIEMIDPGARGLVPDGFGGAILREARRLGIDEDCLRCHTTGHGIDDIDTAESFHPEDGVQCEACHGPGGRHSAWHQSQSGDDEPPEGVRMRIGTLDECTAACHRRKPTHDAFIEATFDAKRAWLKIAH